MKMTSKIVIVLTALFVSFASLAQVPPYKYSCTAQNARGYSWIATGWGIGNAQQNALGECASSSATAYAANCRIVGCTRIGYAPAPVPPPAPVYGQQFFCTAWGYQHRVSGSASGYNLNKVVYKAVRNCSYNGGVNCQVYSSPSCPVQ